MQEILLNNDFYIDLIPRHLNDKPAEVLSIKGEVTSLGIYPENKGKKVEPLCFGWQGQDNDGCKRQSDGSFRLFFDKKIVGNFGEGQLKAELDYTLPSTVFEGGIRAVHDALDLPFTMVKKHSPGYKGEPMVGNSVFLFHLVVDSVKGEPGKSAYQVAIDGGYKGSEEQFNETLGKMYPIRYDLSQWQETGQQFLNTQREKKSVKYRYVELNVNGGVSGEVKIELGTIQPIIAIKGYGSELRSNNSHIHCISSLDVFVRWQDNPTDYNAYVVIPRSATYGWNLRLCVEALV